MGKAIGRRAGEGWGGRRRDRGSIAAVGRFFEMTGAKQLSLDVLRDFRRS